MSGALLLTEIPGDLFEWLQAEAIRCNQSIDELIVDILETHRFWNANHDNENDASEDSNATEDSEAERGVISGTGSEEPRGVISKARHEARRGCKARP